MRLPVATVALATICSCNAQPAIDLGDTTVGMTQVHVTLEGTGKVGETSRYAIALPSSITKPDGAHCWWGTEADTDSEVAAIFDAGDGDFDCQVVRRDTTGRLWISLSYGATRGDGSIAVP